jgi:hypothetical protein
MSPELANLFKEAAGQSLLNSVKRAVDSQRLLLVLDNFEQVLAAAPSVIDLLVALPVPQSPGDQPGRATRVG